MKSVAFHEYGDSSVLQVIERDIPSPAAGEVVVEVVAAPVNPTDLMMRDGKQAAMMTELTPPYIAGMEFSGHVHAVGEGVTLKPGQPVIGVVNPRRQAGGAHTKYVCVPAGQVASVPEGTDLVVAATVPMNALTAMLSLELTGLKAGELLLVTGGAGMLGGSVLQLAKQAGIRAATNAAEADAELVRSLGAETVLPRSEGLSEAFKAAYGKEADGLIDGALIGDHVSHLVKPGGVAVALRKSNPVTDSRLKCTYVSVLDAMARPEMVAAVGEHIAKGSLVGRVAPDGVVPFSEAQAAFTMAEKNTARGRVVLHFAD